MLLQQVSKILRLHAYNLVIPNILITTHVSIIPAVHSQPDLHLNLLANPQHNHVATF